MRRGMIIAQISDTHIDLNGPNRAARLDDFERCVAAINRLSPAADVVIHTGDVAHNGLPGEYAAARRILDELRCPFHVAVGNRDDRDAMQDAFPVTGEILSDALFRQYCIDAHPVRLIVLDTLSTGTNKGEFCQARADALCAALSGKTAKPTVIFMHHPPFEVHESDYPIQVGSWESVDRLRRALDGQDNVAGIFCGHTHRQAAGMVGTVPASSMPSVAVDLRLGDFAAELQATPLYRIHRFDGRQVPISDYLAA